MCGLQRCFKVLCLTALVVSVVLVAVFQYSLSEHREYRQNDSPSSLNCVKLSTQPLGLTGSLVSSLPPQDLSASNSTLGASQKTR